jgi:hypothetical protein
MHPFGRCVLQTNKINKEAIHAEPRCVEESNFAWSWCDAYNVWAWQQGSCYQNSVSRLKDCVRFFWDSAFSLWWCRHPNLDISVEPAHKLQTGCSVQESAYCLQQPHHTPSSLELSRTLWYQNWHTVPQRKNYMHAWSKFCPLRV